MRTAVLILAIVVLSRPLMAQEHKRVPKDSVRVSVPGCSKGYVFTVGPRTPDQTSGYDIPEGMHLRMSGSKKMMAEIKAHEGSMIAITGLMKKDQYRPDGVGIGGGVRIGQGPVDGGRGTPTANQIVIDVESWSPFVGGCPSR